MRRGGVSKYLSAGKKSNLMHFVSHTVHDASFGGGKALFEARLGSMLRDVPLPPSMEYGWD